MREVQEIERGCERESVGGWRLIFVAKTVRFVSKGVIRDTSILECGQNSYSAVRGFTF